MIMDMEGIKYLFKKYFMIPIIIVLFSLALFDPNYHSDFYGIKINNQSIYFAFQGTYKRSLLSMSWNTQLNTSNYFEYETIDVDNMTGVNRIKLNSTINLDYKVIGCYLKNTGLKVRCTYSMLNQYYKYIYKTRDINDETMQIKRKNQVVYDGPFINQLSNVIKEPGRYYFVIQGTYKHAFFDEGKYRISFNVIVEE